MEDNTIVSNIIYEDYLVSSGDLERLSRSETALAVCPCLGEVDGIPVCFNGDTIEEIDLLNLHPDLVCQMTDSTAQDENEALPICYGCVRIDSTGIVKCGSRNRAITIRSRTLTADILEEALDNFPKNMYKAIEDICSSCLYKVLTSVIWNGV